MQTHGIACCSIRCLPCSRVPKGSNQRICHAREIPSRRPSFGSIDETEFCHTTRDNRNSGLDEETTKLWYAYITLGCVKII